MKEVKLVDVNDQCDLYALHFVFMLIIQNHLDMFRAGWANHRLRTEHNRIPLQLWTMGFQYATNEHDPAMLIIICCVMHVQVHEWSIYEH